MKYLWTLLIVSAGCGSQPRMLPAPAVAPPPALRDTFLRALDNDPSDYLCRIFPEGAMPPLDEKRASETECSRFCRPKILRSGGQYDQVLAVHSDVAGGFGLPGAQVAGAASARVTVRALYQPTQKMIAEITNPAEWQQCLEENGYGNRQMISTYIAGPARILSFVGSQGEVEVDAPGGGLEVRDGFMWREATRWDDRDLYGLFATSPTHALRDEGVRAADVGGSCVPVGSSGVCTWCGGSVPTDPAGKYFEFASQPLETEALALDNVMDTATRRVGEYLLGVEWKREQTESREVRGRMSELRASMQQQSNFEWKSEGRVRGVEVRRSHVVGKQGDTSCTYVAYLQVFVGNGN